MEVLGLVVGVLGIVIGVVAWVRWSAGNKAMAAERAELEGKINQLDGRRRKAEKRLEELADRSKRLERDLHIAIERRKEKATARAMWDLEIARAERRWREVVVPGGSAESDARNAGELLTHAVEHDVARLREEVGVSIRFEGAVDCELDPESAIGALRISEEILALATRNADEIVVRLDQETASQGDEATLVIDVSCEGWEDGVAVESDGLLSSIKTMAQRLGGWANYERNDSNVLLTAHVPANGGPTNEAAPEQAQDQPVGG